MISILYFLDVLLFILFVVWIMYFFVFSVGYRAPRKKIKYISARNHKFLIIFPAYKEDAVIVESVMSFLKQDYPHELFKIVVVSDNMLEETNKTLSQLPIDVLFPNYEKRSKAAALNLAISVNSSNKFEGVVILDADNIVFSDFLQHVNTAFCRGFKAVQTHRIAKNENTPTAYLDGISEEINNSIFRQGHTNLGLPAALTGSGMAFEMDWFKKTMPRISSMGEDKELEYYLLLDGIYTTYLDDVYVLDEKVQNRIDLSNQRKRWIAAQIDTFLMALSGWSTIFRTRNWAMLDKLVQWSIPPRIILMGVIPLWIFILSIFASVLIHKWIILYLFFIASLCLAIPNRFYNKRTLMSFLKLPFLFVAILRSFMGIRSGRKTFVHTPHGNKKNEDCN